MTGPAELVDWELADRIAVAVIGGVGPVARRQPLARNDLEQAALEAACERALAIASEYSGLGRVTAPPIPELIDRQAWAGHGLRALSEAAAPLERRLAAELELPRPGRRIARGLVAASIAAEAGVAVGYMARRVLGQYDVPLFGPPRPGRLLFVAENLVSVQRELEAEPKTFLDWIAVHETTHVVQLERVPWLLEHLRGLARELIESVAAGLEAGALSAFGRRLVREPRELLHAAIRGELARVLADPAQRALLDRLAATMSVVEGHAEHVMDSAEPELGPRLRPLRIALDARRRRRGGLGNMLGRLLGMELKLRQYEQGKGFCDRVVELGGPDALRFVWRSAEDLPDLDELAQPQRWLDRVAAASPAPI